VGFGLPSGRCPVNLWRGKSTSQSVAAPERGVLAWQRNPILSLRGFGRGGVENRADFGYLLAS